MKLRVTCWCTLVLRHRVSSKEANKDSGHLVITNFSGGRSWAAILHADCIPFTPKLRLRWKLRSQWTSPTSLFRDVITLPFIPTHRGLGKVVKGRRPIGSVVT
uniref:Uncharacterized protein n=1 Tax=Ixodes ricinus TaxID=34613 RepID=A0A6B0U7T2_IXORI